MQSLLQAKQALIAYAVNHNELKPEYAGQFAMLPCPDSSNNGEEGQQDSPCGARYVNAI